MESGLEVEGSNLRVAGRNYYEVNHHNRGRLLTSAERKELNNRVQALLVEFDEPSWKTWRSIHRAIGVDGIDELHIEHRDQVNFILDLLEKQCLLHRQVHDAGLPELPEDNSAATLEQKISKGGIITWVMEFPEYAGFLFFMGIVAGATLIAI